MLHFWKYFGRCMIWLFLSEILCLILAFSLAILKASLLSRVLSLLFGVFAHVLLTGSCAQNIAKEDAADYRRGEKRVSPMKPLLLAVCTMLPALCTYALLCANPESILMLNLYPLLNAPYIQIHRLLIDNTEPFSAISGVRRVLMALPPLVTAVSWWIGYQLQYIPELAKTDAANDTRV